MKTKKTIKVLVLLTIAVLTQACSQRYQAHCPTYGNPGHVYTRLR